MTAKNPLPPQEVLCKLFAYNSSDGTLAWREKGLEWFTYRGKVDEQSCRKWNARYAGKLTMKRVHPQGYLFGELFGKIVVSHKIIWKMVHGTEPIRIYHKNGNKADNRISNLWAKYFRKSR